jgi:imidazolonepropionase-like amidohydrolase
MLRAISAIYYPLITSPFLSQHSQVSERNFVFKRAPWIFLTVFCCTFSAAAQNSTTTFGAQSVAGTSATPVTVIRAGKLIDVDAGRELSNQVIVIRDGKVVSVAASAGAAIPSDAKVIDLSNMTVLPGLIDCHTHLVGDAKDTDPVSELRKTSAVRAFESIPNAKVTLLAGFTTVRDVGTYRALVDVALRDAIARGDVLGPRMFVAGAYITITGGGGSLNGVAPDITLPWDLRFGVADGPEEVRQRVRALEANDVDLIKVIATGAFLSHGSVPTTNDFTYDEIRAAVEEANKKGLRVAAHAHGASGIKDAVRAGVASIEHGTMIDDEGLRMMKEHGTYLVADIYDDDCISTGLNGEPGDFQAKESVYGELQRQNFKKAVQLGVKIAFGTDASVCPHGTNAKQFAYQVKYGQTAMQAIQSATINAADLIGKPQEFGSIAAGKSADIIAVNGDPLSDVHLLEHVAFVMKEGTVYKQ